MIILPQSTKEFRKSLDIAETFRALVTAHGPKSFLLESVFDKTSSSLAKRFSSNSIICLTPLVEVRCKNGKCTLSGEKGIVSKFPKGLRAYSLGHGETPLDYLRRIHGSFALANDAPDGGASAGDRFSAGFVGYVTYELAAYFENLPAARALPDPLALPELCFVLHRDYVLYEHDTGKVRLVTHCAPKDAPKTLATLEKHLALVTKTGANHLKSASTQKSPVNSPTFKISCNKSKKEFMAMVEKAKGYIRIGDVFQVVPSRRLCIESSKPPFETYESLRAINPSPYMFYLGFGEFEFIGASPETQVRLTDGLIEVRPIAGTRRRGANAREEKALEKELMADEKELAEHTMLVDLARNDIGRVCRPGSLSLPESFLLEKYSHVQHIVSHVTGKLAEGSDAFDVLMHTFPAGTVSGAPKIRAMEIIAELEGEQRGAYAGAMGYFDLRGNMDFCISIRMIVRKGRKHYLQAGAGIVADSKPEREYVESREKLNSTAYALTGTELDD